MVLRGEERAAQRMNGGALGPDLTWTHPLDNPMY